MLFNTIMHFRITNISRIILSQCIKSLNLQECANWIYYEKVCNAADAGNGFRGDGMRLLPRSGRKTYERRNKCEKDRYDEGGGSCPSGTS